MKRRNLTEKNFTFKGFVIRTVVWAIAGGTVGLVIVVANDHRNRHSILGKKL